MRFTRVARGFAGARPGAGASRFDVRSFADARGFVDALRFSGARFADERFASAGARFVDLGGGRSSPRLIFSSGVTVDDGLSGMPRFRGVVRVLRRADDSVSIGAVASPGPSGRTVPFACSWRTTLSTSVS